MRITLADIPSPPNRTGSIPVLFGPTLEGIPPTPVPPCKILVHFGPTLEGIPHTPVPLGKITVGTGLTPVVFPATLGGSGYTPMLLLEICGKKRHCMAHVAENAIFAMKLARPCPATFEGRSRGRWCNRFGLGKQHPKNRFPL